MNVGENQRLHYTVDGEVSGFALSGEFVTSANKLYKELYSA